MVTFAKFDGGGDAATTGAGGGGGTGHSGTVRPISRSPMRRFGSRTESIGRPRARTACRYSSQAEFFAPFQHSTTACGIGITRCDGSTAALSRNQSARSVVYRSTTLSTAPGPSKTGSSSPAARVWVPSIKLLCASSSANCAKRLKSIRPGHAFC